MQVPRTSISPRSKPLKSRKPSHSTSEPARKKSSCLYKFCSQNPILPLALIMGFAAVNLILFSLYLSNQDEATQSHVHPLRLHPKRVDFSIEKTTNTSQVTAATQIGLNLATLLNITKVLLNNPIDKMSTQFKASISEYNPLCVSKAQGWGNLTGDMHHEVVKEVCQNLRELFVRFIDVERNLQYLVQPSFDQYSQQVKDNTGITAELKNLSLKETEEFNFFLSKTGAFSMDTTNLCGVSGILLQMFLVQDFINFFLKTGEAIFTNYRNISEQIRYKIPLNPNTLSDDLTALTDFLHSIGKKGIDLFGYHYYEGLPVQRFSEKVKEVKYFTIDTALMAYGFHLQGPVIEIFRNRHNHSEWLLNSRWTTETVINHSLGDISKFLKTLAEAIKSHPNVFKSIFVHYIDHIYEVLLGKLEFKGQKEVYDDATKRVINGLDSLQEGQFTLWNRNHHAGEIVAIPNTKNTNLPPFILVAKNNDKCSLYCVIDKENDPAVSLVFILYVNQLLRLAEQYAPLQDILKTMNIAHLRGSVPLP